jgi:drug/metabolite transporter (DMT)-like permease
MSRFHSKAVLVALGMIWGLTIPLTKIAVSTGHRPLGLIFWQLLILAVALAAISVARRGGPVVNQRTLLYFLIVALLGAIIPNSFSYLAAAHLPAGVLGIIIASVPIFSLGIALSLRSEQPTIKRSIGVLLGAGAVILLIGPQTSLPDPDQAVFVLVALAAPFCYGAEGNYIATRAPAGMDSVATLLGASALGCVIVWPLAMFTNSWVDLFKPWERAEWALLLSSLLHVIAYTGYVWLVGMTGAVFASQVSYVVTVSAVLLSSLILSETYSAWVWSALALMIAGLALVQPHGTNRRNPDASG